MNRVWAAPSRTGQLMAPVNAARTAIENATRPLIHQKTLVIVSDDQDHIAWAAASDGWETDYRSGSSPEMD